MVAAEAAIVREIFDRFTRGEAPYSIAVDLNRRGIKTAKGMAWSEATGRQQLRNKHVAGICWHNGQEVAVGKWLPIIPRAQWDFAQELLTFRSVAARKKRTRNRTPRASFCAAWLSAATAVPRWPDAAEKSTGARAPTAKTGRSARGPCKPDRWRNSWKTLLSGCWPG